MVVFDTTILLPLLWPDVPEPRNPNTNQLVEGFRERINHLLETIEKSRTKIIIPTPALSEILVRTGAAGPGYLAQITAASVFRIVAFDVRAAVEVAAMTRKARDFGDKRGGADGTWNKIKFDRQIVAIARVENATALYSDDLGVRRFGEAMGMTVIGSWELELPPKNPQGSLDLPRSQNSNDDPVD
ncbi:MAG: type II toxin-antitoxin system VapC family toxin [Alphaproteobacteria bacterium]